MNLSDIKYCNGDASSLTKDNISNLVDSPAASMSPIVSDLASKELMVETTTSKKGNSSTVEIEHASPSTVGASKILCKEDFKTSFPDVSNYFFQKLSQPIEILGNGNSLYDNLRKVTIKATTIDGWILLCELIGRRVWLTRTMKFQ